jgi:hypothetical protein
LQQRFDLLFDPLLIELADAIDLRSQVSDLVFMADLSLMRLTEGDEGDIDNPVVGAVDDQTDIVNK